MSAGLWLVGEEVGGALFFMCSARQPEGFHLSNPVRGKVRRALAEGAYEKIALCAAVR